MTIMEDMAEVTNHDSSDQEGSGPGAFFFGRCISLMCPYNYNRDLFSVIEMEGESLKGNKRMPALEELHWVGFSVILWKHKICLFQDVM